MENDRTAQILAMHAGFINGVVEVIHGSRSMQDLETVLNAAQQNGWEDVVRVTRLIVSGSRDMSLLNTLDEEDSVIIRAILQGLQNPASLPSADQQTDGTMAAPGLASMIAGASGGDVTTLQALAVMSEQMTAAGGDMARLAGVMRRLVNGERSFDTLSEGMGPRAASLLRSILDELTKMQVH